MVIKMLKNKSTLILLTFIALLATTSVGVSRSSEESNESRKLAAKSAWHGPYFTWLTNEQKSELDDIVADIDSQSENFKIKAMLAKTLEFYNNVGEELEMEATEKLQMFCKLKMTSFFDSEEMRMLENLRDTEVPKKQLFAKFNEFVLELADNEDRRQVRIYAAFCKKIYKLD